MMRASTTVVTVDVGESAAYYRDRLGFDIAFEYGEPTFYIGLCSGEVTLHLISAARRRGRPAMAPCRSSSTMSTRSMPIW